MARDRLDLQAKFEEILGSRNVYFNPPENLKLQYPCIIYNISGVYRRDADNSLYGYMNRYTVTLIDKKPDSEFYVPLLSMRYCTFDRSYKSEGMNVFSFNLYF